jgi:hypothetical protein
MLLSVSRKYGGVLKKCASGNTLSFFPEIRFLARLDSEQQLD